VKSSEAEEPEERQPRKPYGKESVNGTSRRFKPIGRMSAIPPGPAGRAIDGQNRQKSVVEPSCLPKSSRAQIVPDPSMVTESVTPRGDVPFDVEKTVADVADY